MADCDCSAAIERLEAQIEDVRNENAELRMEVAELKAEQEAREDALRADMDDQATAQGTALAAVRGEVNDLQNETSARLDANEAKLNGTIDLLVGHRELSEDAVVDGPDVLTRIEDAGVAQPETTVAPPEPRVFDTTAEATLGRDFTEVERYCRDGAFEDPTNNAHMTSADHGVLAIRRVMQERPNSFGNRSMTEMDLVRHINSIDGYDIAQNELQRGLKRMEDWTGGRVFRGELRDGTKALKVGRDADLYFVTGRDPPTPTADADADAETDTVARQSTSSQPVTDVVTSTAD